MAAHVADAANSEADEMRNRIGELRHKLVYTPINVKYRQAAIVAALKLMVYDKKIYNFLRYNDPKALEQIIVAIKLIDPDPTGTAGIISQWEAENRKKDLPLPTMNR